MQVRVRHGKDKQSEAFARFHRVVCDQPFDEEGSDTGMTPPELMLAALGCCAMHYASEYLKARHQIAIEVDAPGLSIRAREGLLKAVEACLLRRTLLDPPRVRIDMATEVVEDPPAKERAQIAS